jgi:predicted ATPase/class 3 adenylate cyclase/DNA-binding CsgD family transcriptional regulator
VKSSTTLTKPIRWGEAMSEFVLPTGTVTLLMADIEGSVRNWESNPNAMTAAISRHDELVTELIGRDGGVRPQDQGEGDSFLAAFARPSEALACALDLQLGIKKEDWGGADIRLRIALHTGEVELRNESNYVGSTINRTARLRSLAHGGQTVLSASTYDLVVDRLPGGASLKDLGVHRLKDLARPEHVYQLGHSELPGGFPPLRSLDALPNNLPVQLTSFVGREKEIEEIKELLNETRMLTLTGSGGCGKTRLALQVAADLLDDYEGGAWLVDLASLNDPDLIPVEVTSTLRVPERKEVNATEALIEYLKSAPTLILLDNCEHLVSACAELAETLLTACPSLTIIATSREPLGVSSETSWRVPSLSLPDPTKPALVEGLTQYEAVWLFIERAVKSRSNFKVTNENAPAVAQICHRLDGIPLAIELAAARVRVLTVQQTLQASVEWSYNLLSEVERMLLARLSLFMGGFTLDAAEAVAAGGRIESTQVLDLLSQLVDKSLVLMDDVERPDARYHMLETIRQYATDRLVESSQVARVRTSHMEYFLDLGERDPAADLHEYAFGGDQAIAKLSNEVDNYRSATTWALSQRDPEPKLRLAAICARLLGPMGHRREAKGLLEEALESAEGASATTRATALLEYGWTNHWFEGGSALMATAEEALRLAEEAEESRLADDARVLMGEAALQLGDHARVRAVSAEIEGSGSTRQIAHAIALRAANDLYLGNLSGAKALFEQAAELARRSSSFPQLFHFLHHLGITLVFRGEFNLAEKCFDEAAEIADRDNLGDPRLLFYRSTLALYRGEYEEARALCEEGIVHSPPDESPAFAGGGKSFMAQICAAQGEGARAMTLLEEGMALLEAAGLDPLAIALPGDIYRIAGRLDLARQFVLTPQELAQRPAWNLVVALAAFHEAKLERDDGHYDEAETRAFEALSAFHGFTARVWVVDALEVVAELAAGQASFEEAGRIFAAAQSARDEIGYVRFPVEGPPHESAFGRVRQELGERFQKIWSEGAAMSLDEAVEYALRGRGTRKRPTAGWKSLTPAELRVAELIAEGLSNAKVAERLFISPYTVETHLKKIFSKLGFKNRAELAVEYTKRSRDQSEYVDD